ncbi:hypothetical protein FRACYDRAFT_245644 [Fragilariopsis cylindrus CCMP1102]|uniref:Uncharacterized protein n=1 Tax=Fragilariopsis cylindrus CCMP1102 TaxID=635003 RepID=A0A1E7EZS8_9STRA|nr:hypothetical protein FRACYDRAFT_245644 [Fragilariopsis cylindrus CCMP1102]|eukprot:OEU11334.1 hypothetical protein FRACYDRAFT_245644 [Fragilariopsis cylindrus CCMP1102]
MKIYGHHQRLWIIVLCAIPRFSAAGIFSKGGPDPVSFAQRKKSLFSVDPQNIIRLVCRHGGVVLPESIKKDLDVLASVCQCTETSLDLINKELVVKGFQVAMPMKKKKANGEKTALRVGRIYLTWDSYLKPCIDIEVEDVDILIEFVNLILSKNNWSELSEIGFPPQLYDEDEIVDSSSEAASAFVRIGGIVVKGQIRLKLRSRPLDKDLCEDIVFDFDNLKTLNTTKSKSSVVDTAVGALKPESGGKTIRDAKKLFSKGRDVAMKYANDIGQKAEEHVDDNINNLGLSRSDLKNLMARGISNASRDSFTAKKEMRNEQKSDDVEYT